MGFVDNAFGQRMAIVADRANLPVREKEFLSLERVPATHASAIDGNEKFVVDTRLRRTWQPARPTRRCSSSAGYLRGRAARRPCPQRQAPDSDVAWNPNSRSFPATTPL